MVRIYSIIAYLLYNNIAIQLLRSSRLPGGNTGRGDINRGKIRTIAAALIMTKLFLEVKQHEKVFEHCFSALPCFRA